MRVKIAYTVELEEIENEVREIIHRALLNMEDALDDSQKASNKLETGETEILSVVEMLDLARRKLSKADIILADCQQILLGYQATLEKIEQETNNEKD